ncbi:MAG: aspartate--tRNA ligase [SAR324 cluster bacterium]|jgi:aspartyl-tRNA synthetase|nr:aspartate--tRNA ligase [SAR324 cluster bacterium]MDG2064450.1 aspartate--tRNA ligase [SAR324 cluster bacterium]MDP6211195.1 aspartate--tRNA ligase [SAR324 cluster bacterium]MDP6294997.1 aspartate--tRNA ligase [SAR324 cluster bacterium]RZO44522.1 MAG: aspartate--tRNA ligase [Pseudomonadota bacterium]
MNKKMEWKRTHYCSDLRVEDVDREVVLMGWCKTRRDHGGVIFVDLRDYTGITQIVFKVEISESSHVLADTIRGEFVLAVKGKVAHRIEGNVNPKLPTGQIEVLIENLEILNQSLTPPYVLDDRENVDEKLRLTYRFLDLRDSTLQNNLMLRSKAMQIVRNYYTSQRFFEIETPILTKSTPEGARDYLVPSRVNPGLFYALPQSPQLFKQLLMISGYDRYMQIARCFRDEDLRGNRQPEFTQIDLELSFSEPEEIYELTEALMVQLFEQTIGVKVETPFPRMTYQQAMENYGSDAPDIRFELKLIDISDIAADCELRVFKQVVDKGGIVKAICVPGGAEFSRKDLDDLTEFAQIYGAKGMAWIKRNPDGWQSPIAKFFTDEQKQALEERVGLNEGDLVLFCADQKKVVYDALGNLRKEIAQRRGLLNDSEYRFVWVTDFPLFEYSETEKSYTSSHHPFTMPDTDDLEKYAENSPEKIRSRAYDVVLNGVEIGGGSIRIHREDIQNKVFKLLKLTEEEIESKFGFLMKALSFGAPPHGGIALGFDRLMMFLLKTNSIRDVIAFPKTQKAGCLMTDAPSAVETDQLDELHIRVKASAQQME